MCQFGVQLFYLAQHVSAELFALRGSEVFDREVRIGAAGCFDDNFGEPENARQQWLVDIHRLHAVEPCRASRTQ